MEQLSNSISLLYKDLDTACISKFYKVNFPFPSPAFPFSLLSPISFPLFLLYLFSLAPFPSLPFLKRFTVLSCLFPCIKCSALLQLHLHTLLLFSSLPSSPFFSYLSSYLLHPKHQLFIFSFLCWSCQTSAFLIRLFPLYCNHGVGAWLIST